MTIKKYNKGLLKRKKVLGEQYVNKTIKKTNSFNKDFQKYITEHCWDNLWISRSWDFINLYRFRYCEFFSW